MKGLLFLELLACTDCAINSFPVPDSPRISTVISVFDILPMALNTSCIDPALPTILDLDTSKPSCRLVFFVFVALITNFLISFISNGFVRYSKAPPLYADSALSMFA